MSKVAGELIELSLADPFEIAYARVEKKTNIVVRIEEGLGAGAPSSTCGESADTVLAALPKLAQCVSGDLDDLTGFHQRAENLLPGNPAARAAVDMALYDRAARRAGLPLWRFLDVPNPNGRESTISIGFDTVEGTLARMAKFPGTRVFKIKAGYPGDVERIALIARRSGKRLRVDANGGWDLETAKSNVRRLGELGVEMIEQPLPPELHGRLGELRGMTQVPIFVDEGCRTAADVPRYAGFVDGVNAKLMKCGGIWPALQMVAAARTLELKLMLGCMIECAISVTAAAHLGGLFDYLDLDSHLLFTDDPYRGMIHQDGLIRLPQGNGLGVTMTQGRGLER